MKNTEEIINSYLYKRLTEFRVDFAYSKSLYFSALSRINKEQTKKERVYKKLEAISILLDIITISGVAVLLSSFWNIGTTIIIGILSIVSLLISIVLYKNNKQHNETQYSNVANEYLKLLKMCKNMEAKCQDGLINIETLGNFVDQLIIEQTKLTSLNLQTTASDYEDAKKSITGGNNAYTEMDFKNT